jgi:hypothetical protein
VPVPIVCIGSPLPQLGVPQIFNVFIGDRVARIPEFRSYSAIGAVLQQAAALAVP